MAGVAGAIAVGVWVVTRALPVLTLREALLAGEDCTIVAGQRDGAFFGGGWSQPVDMGVTVRVSNSAAPVIWIPLLASRDYDLTFRLDPFPAPAEGTAEPRPVVWLWMNGRPLSRFELEWTPGRIGSYDVRLPASMVKDGFNRFAFSTGVSVRPGVGAQASEQGGYKPRLRLWYVRVRPGLHAQQAEPHLRDFGTTQPGPGSVAAHAFRDGPPPAVSSFQLRAGQLRNRRQRCLRRVETESEVLVGIRREDIGRLVPVRIPAHPHL